MKIENARFSIAWELCKRHDWSGMGENMAVDAEGRSQGMYKSIDLQHT